MSLLSSYFLRVHVVLVCAWVGMSQVSELQQPDGHGAGRAEHVDDLEIPVRHSPCFSSSRARSLWGPAGEGGGVGGAVVLWRSGGYDGAVVAAHEMQLRPRTHDALAMTSLSSLCFFCARACCLCMCVGGHVTDPWVAA